MPLKKFKQPLAWLFLCFILQLLCACKPFLQTTNIKEIQKRGSIIMGTINNSLTYSYDGTNYSGFDYELGKQFAVYLNVELQIKEYSSLNELFHALDNREVDFIGSALTLTPKRAKKYRSSPPYYYVSQKVVYHKGTYRPRKIADVNAPISVIKDSSHEETLDSLLDEAPDLAIKIVDGEDQESLLGQIADKEIKYAIVDSSTLAQKQRYYPALAEAFTISEKQPVAWLIKREKDNTVYSAMIEFIGNRHQDQTISKFEEKYFGHVGHFDYVDTRIFLKRIKKTLPKYEPLFKEFANSEVNWLLLASVSYQESHWNPNARSPTGVRGMMMLTLDTADYIGIKNRLDPKQSIQGGAKYLKILIKRLPDSIPENEKIWFALASYNIGYGHLMDARRITSLKKQNPDAWSDVKENLPLLHQRKWYKQTRYGYARGREAQHYVNNIRQYKKTLTWFINERDKKIAEEKKQQEAKERALAMQLALQIKSNESDALITEPPVAQITPLQQAQKDLLNREVALKAAQEQTLAKKLLLQKSKDKRLIEEKALQESKDKAFTQKYALQELKNKQLVAQKAFQISQDKISLELKTLQIEVDKSIAQEQIAQQSTDKALAKQKGYQQEKEQAEAKEKSLKQAKEYAREVLQKEQDKLNETNEIEAK